MSQSPADDHVFLPGKMTGLVTLDDGTVVNVTPDQVGVDHLSADQVEELAYKVSSYYVANGHPDDIEEDENGNLVQRPFEYTNPPKRFAADLKKISPKGTPSSTPEK